MMGFKTFEEAAETLKAKGMYLVRKSTFSDQVRAYFAYGSNDVLFDHSATVTLVGEKWVVSDFTEISVWPFR